MNKIRDWYLRNYTEITWFLIGWMSFALLIDFSKGDWAGCLFDIVVIAINVYFIKK